MAMRWSIRRVSRNKEFVADFPNPGDSSECRGWQPHVAVFALAPKVIAVANTRVEGRWKAYVDAVPGKNHDEEWQDVRAHGTALQENVAKVLFPGFAGIPYSRYEMSRWRKKSITLWCGTSSRACLTRQRSQFVAAECPARPT